MIRGRTLQQLKNRLTASLDAKAGQLASGAITPAEFVVQTEELLAYSHSRAALLGSHRAKRGGNLDVAIRVAARATIEQREFLLGFARDLANGVYRPKAQGGKGARNRMGRFALYSLRLGGTSNTAWLETLKAGNSTIEVKWLLGSVREHCSSCRVEASYGWRNVASLTRVPGDGTTQCMVRCHCRLQTRDGAESYAL